MKRNIRDIIVFGLLTLAIVAQGQDRRFYFKADAGLSVIEDIKTESFFNLFGLDPDARIKMDPGISIGVAGGYVLGRNWAVELQSGLIWNSVNEIEVKSGEVGTSVKPGEDLYQFPLMANIIYRIPLKSSFKPYLGVGSGGVFSTISGDDMDGDDFTFAIQGLAGVDYELNDRTSVGIGYRYMASAYPEYGDVELKSVCTHSILAVLTLRF